MNKIIILSIFFIVGLLIFLINLIYYFKIKSIMKRGFKTIATITNKEKKRSNTLSGADEFPVVYYKYELTYIDNTGKKIIKASDFGNQKNLEIGEQIEVIYNKNKTDDFIIFAKQQKKFYLYLIALGIVFILLGTMFYTLLGVG